MAKVYEYKGKHYCEVDMSETDEDYIGDLLELYWDMQEYGDACERSVYYRPNDPEEIYDEPEELIEKEFGHLVIGEAEEEE